MFQHKIFRLTNKEYVKAVTCNQERNWQKTGKGPDLDNERPPFFHFSLVSERALVSPCRLCHCFYETPFTVYPNIKFAFSKPDFVCNASTCIIAHQ